MIIKIEQISQDIKNGLSSIFFIEFPEHENLINTIQTEDMSDELKQEFLSLPNLDEKIKIIYGNDVTLEKENKEVKILGKNQVKLFTQEEFVQWWENDLVYNDVNYINQYYNSDINKVVVTITYK